MAEARFRLYAELNDFLAPGRRGREFTAPFARGATVKNALEALGVPHTEVEVVLVNGESVAFGHRLHPGDRVSAYPVFEALDVTPLLRVRARPLRRPRFLADAHLGGLARGLRMLGFDTVVAGAQDDAALAAWSARETRVLLSRDRELLMHAAVTHGCFVRALRPVAQLREILERMDLYGACAPLTRCLACNAVLAECPRGSPPAAVPAAVARQFRRFWACTGCGRVYWQGSHYRRMRVLVEELLAGRGGPMRRPG